MKKTVLILVLFCSCSIYRVIPKQFTGETTFYVDFTKENNSGKLYVQDNVFYNDNPVLFKSEMVRLVKDTGLIIDCIYNPGIIETWQKKDSFDFISGMVSSWIKENSVFTQQGGVWSFEAKFPDSWAAIWLLSPDYYIEKFDRYFIIPEIDLAENNGYGFIDNCIHYGYTKDKYNRESKVRRGFVYDGLFHTYTVEFKKDGYDFFVDGFLSNKFRSNDPEFVTNQPYYFVINNANDSRFLSLNTEFIIRQIKIQQWEKH